MRDRERPHYLLVPAVESGTGDRAQEDPEIARCLDEGLASLDRALFGGTGTLRIAALVDAARDAGAGEADPLRLAVEARTGVHLVVAVPLPARRSGPGAPTAVDRALEAGLRLGAAAGGGVLHWPAPDVAPGPGLEAGAPAVSTATRIAEALWRGARLGAQCPGAECLEADGSAERAIEPVFASGGEVAMDARVRAEAVAWVRDLVERPANLLGPEDLAREIAALVATVGPALRCEIWEPEEIRRRGFGATLAVGGGSAREPRVVRVRWESEPDAAPALGLVGKGVTFDSGGLNIKRDPGEMSWMKSDMAAAAAVAAALVVSARLGEPGRPVEAILSLCDNAVSGASMRPGDVVTHPGGSRTEVVDTDCEGRLILADGIGWARSAGHAAIIDVGTLSDGGAGLRVTGAWSNDDALSGVFEAAAARAGDPVWLIPLPYGEEPGALGSRVADRRNASLDRPDAGRHAAGFLAAIAGPVPWLHLDIGGTAYLEHPLAGWAEGPTGASTLALAEFIGEWVRSGPEAADADAGAGRSGHAG